MSDYYQLLLVFYMKQFVFGLLKNIITSLAT